MGQPSKLSISAIPKEDIHCNRTGHSDSNFKTGPILKLQTV